MMDYMRNQCPERGPGLPHTMHGVDGDPCRECGMPLTTTPPSPRLPARASEARRTLHTSHAMREAGVPPMDTPPPDHDENTPVERRAVTGDGPQGKPHGLGRGTFTRRDEQRVRFHVEYRAWLAKHGGGEER